MPPPRVRCGLQERVAAFRDYALALRRAGWRASPNYKQEYPARPSQKHASAETRFRDQPLVTSNDSSWQSMRSSRRAMGPPSHEQRVACYRAAIVRSKVLFAGSALPAIRLAFTYIAGGLTGDDPRRAVVDKYETETGSVVERRRGTRVCARRTERTKRPTCECTSEHDDANWMSSVPSRPRPSRRLRSLRPAHHHSEHTYRGRVARRRLWYARRATMSTSSVRMGRRWACRIIKNS